jgi:1,4-alpha-glucan branching enzyme
MVVIGTDGWVEFRVYLPHAQRVDVVGDFNDWAAGACRMGTGDGDEGWWRARVAVGAGRHRFAYLVNTTWAVPDFGASGVERSDSGRLVSVVRVEGGERATPGREAGADAALAGGADAGVVGSAVVASRHPHAG